MWKRFPSCICGYRLFFLKQTKESFPHFFLYIFVHSGKSLSLSLSLWNGCFLKDANSEALSRQEQKVSDAALRIPLTLLQAQRAAPQLPHPEVYRPINHVFNLKSKLPVHQADPGSAGRSGSVTLRPQTSQDEARAPCCVCAACLVSVGSV